MKKLTVYCYGNAGATVRNVLYSDLSNKHTNQSANSLSGYDKATQVTLRSKIPEAWEPISVEEVGAP